MEDNNFDNLMMSDSIRGQIPDLEDDAVKKLEDSFLVAALEVKFGDSIEPLVGSTVGLSFESDMNISVDLRVSTPDAFDLLKKHGAFAVECTTFYVYLGQEEICHRGPYRFTSLKVLDFDHQNKMCTLGIDMVRV